MHLNNFQMIINWGEEDLAYLVGMPELGGCITDYRPRQEAISIAEILIQEWLETTQDQRRSISQPHLPPTPTITGQKNIWA
jgi:predicted RNase H-like HicB family nuclease